MKLKFKKKIMKKKKNRKENKDITDINASIDSKNSEKVDFYV